MKRNNLVLAIETSLKKGSLSLLRGEIEIANWSGNESVSRSEDLVLSISEILKKNDLRARDLDIIAVSNGPGSFTGLRVGIAAAKGLGLAIGCPVLGVSILELMANQIFQSSNLQNMELMSIAGAGRENVYTQVFASDNKLIKPISEIKISDITNLQSEIARFEKVEIVFAEDISEYILNLKLNRENLTLCLTNKRMAEYAGLYALRQFQRTGNLISQNAAPIYVRNL